MSVKNILSKIDHFKTAIESIEVLVSDYDHDVLKPTLNYLNEQKALTAKELSSFKENIQVRFEEVTNRLSNI